ncbi:MAG: hypothetical protein Q8L88_10995 [Bacteroidota bacterium]|nr:hypothetical protein [Bacteroidota bacterium]
MKTIITKALLLVLLGLSIETTIVNAQTTPDFIAVGVMSNPGGSDLPPPPQQ